MTITPIESPLQLGACRLKNRLVALPIFTGYAYPDGRVSPLMQAHYARLAASGVAMVVVANAAVSPAGITSQCNLRIDHDDCLPGLRALADCIREQNCLACIQLNHAGRFAKTEQPLLASAMAPAHLTYHVSSLKGFMQAFPFEQRFGLTRFFLKQVAAWRRAMTAKETDEVVDQFAAAAARAHAAGFDMVEIHGANGYLLCEFLSPATNKQASAFGGTFEARAAFPLAVVRAVRDRLPRHVPLGYRLPLREWVPGGIQLEEAIAFARLLAQAGIGYVSAAAGTFNSIFRPAIMQKMARPAYLREDVSQLTAQVPIPTVISGRIATPALANELLRQKAANLIGLGRPLRVDEDWVRKCRSRLPAIKPCINCNACLQRVILDQGFVCRCWPKTTQLKIHLDCLLLRRNFEGVCVIADAGDPPLFSASLPRLLPRGRWLPAPAALTLLFAGHAEGMRCRAADWMEFRAWVQAQAAPKDQNLTAVAVVDKTIVGSWGKEIGAEINRQNWGLVLIARNPAQPWRTRIFYTLRHKVIGLISPNPQLQKLVVFIDFSDASLLALAFVRRIFMDQRDLRPTFVHVLSGNEAGARKRWRLFKKAAAVDPATPLKLLPSGGDVAAAVLAEMAREQYGTIVMGKRGLSGIKRLLLGSISNAVLRRSENQSLFLVD